MLIKWIPKSTLHLNIAFILSALISFVSIIKIQDILKDKKQEYTDITVGNIIWTDYFKTMDYQVVLGLVFIFIICFVSLCRLLNIMDLKFNRHHFINNRVYFCFFSLVYSITLLIFSNGAYYAPSLVFALVPLITEYIVSKIQEKEKEAMFWSVLTIVPITYLGTAGVIVIANLVFNELLTGSLKSIPLVVSLILWLSALTLLKFKVNSTFSLIKHLLMTSQLFAPFTFMSAVTITYYYNNEIIKINHNKSFIILLLFVCLLFCFQIIHFSRKKNTPLLRWSETISFSTLASISFVVIYSTPIYSTLIHDDFHMGEILLPWQQVVELGQSYNSEFISVQGLLGMLYSGMNELLFSGTVSSFNSVLVLVPALFSIITISVISIFYGKKWGLLFVILYIPIAVSPIMSRVYLVLPILLTLFYPNLIKKPVRWFVLWIWLSAIHCFYNPAIGAVLTIATLPFAMYMLSTTIKHKIFQKMWHNQKIKLLIYLSLQLVALIFLFPSIIGTVVYLLDNSSTNTVAYGVGVFAGNQTVPEWFPQWFKYNMMNRLIWESVRIGGWIGTLMILFWVGYKFLMQKSKDINMYFYIFTIFSFIILISSYSFGRVDPWSLNRSGSISILCMTGFLPFLFFMIYKNRTMRISVVLFLGVTLGVMGILINNTNSFKVEKLTNPISVPSQAMLINGTDYNLPSLGKIFIEPGRLEELVIFKEVMDKVLKDDETFGDLTNRSMLYYILNKKVPSLYSADYLAANETIQSKVVGHLKKNKPPIVFIGPSIRHDGGPSSLRSYRIYKWYLENGYQYYEYKGLQFLVNEVGSNRINRTALSKSENVELLSNVFVQKDLMSIPIAWGRNLSRIDRFDGVNIQLKEINKSNIQRIETGWNHVTGTDPYITWEVNAPMDGLKSDFISFELDFKTTPTYPFKLQLFWDVENQISERNSFYFNGYDGTYLLPLGSNPSWLLNEAIRYIRLDIDGLDESTEFEVKNIKILHLIK
ncbi:hypothetical protein AB4Z29_18950 [Paenibacillus sp. 2TAB23]|uniref:hypothetical protein n=1 Tax=Paenibacillus sp. 2TAB23 TaxID=3233004 RepID=UPI003F946B78